mmetsp:Transcript_16204/g.33263  ORF Transcript_16204/g.33263 Transcript_16204/m.33263 type:complete len:155 (-) Transcript_16204:378-842(-)|eukprot:CAMPEP_0183306722 /NCGR_PEP_ID=MMETSP0160_2-20130417/13545_1 /TAXON_ID=2839 ORGANISM="Odontella Sinensis, Strain Grunow 1884" /NCGR_SAMPLE_ID=MMETSP0160_2 /ASSEMBLY_ACC=CAM_ASM_000250 /LENGTH=154 /DNA_ID=CAMNT_0025470167 /DNA_START=106 /DNA_END=570 /DNA_ORIENTATION=+
MRSFASFLVLVAVTLIGYASGFTTPNVPSPAFSTSLRMGLFDALGKAFSNEEYSAPPEGVKATARHILVKTTEEADEIIERLQGGATFASLASQFSTCPSGSSGGSLGSFSPGTMVAEFDKVIFSPETNLGEVVGPVQTQFGYHLIVVDKRTGI